MHRMLSIPQRIGKISARSVQWEIRIFLYRSRTVQQSGNTDRWINEVHSEWSMCVVYMWILFRTCVLVVSSGCLCIMVGVHLLGTVCTWFENVSKWMTQWWPRTSWCHTSHVKMAVTFSGRCLEAAISNWKFHLEDVLWKPMQGHVFSGVYHQI